MQTYNFLMLFLSFGVIKIRSKDENPGAIIADLENALKNI